MLKLSFVLVFLLLAGEAQINGEEESTTIVRTDIKGRLLTPEEGCGYSKVANTRIVGGGPAKNGAWPWLVLLGLKHFIWIPEFVCGGSLITSRHVLTAAHCFNAEITFARLGEYDTRSFTDGKHEDIEIARKIPHEQYDDRLLIHDIAIILLKRDATFNDRVSPICIPEHIPSRYLVKNKPTSFVGSNPFVAGWGYMKEKSRMTNILQQVQVPVVSNAECRDKHLRVNPNYYDIQFDPDLVVCAGQPTGGKDSCQGDSGGPMMKPENVDGRFPFFQIGVVSNGIGCARDTPGVYTNVRYYTKWIWKQLE